MSSEDHSRLPLLIGIDFGTTRVRAGVYTPDGRLAASCMVPTPTVTAASGEAHHAADMVWKATIEAIRAALRHLPDPSRIVGIACASVGEAGVLVDAAGEAISPIIAWYDRRASAECQALAGRVGDDALYAITGQPVEPILGIYKLLWIKAHWQELYDRAARWLSIADYLALRLSGKISCESSLACRVGVFDLQRGAWSAELLREAGLRPGLFAEPTANGTQIGRIARDAAVLSGLPDACVVSVGGHDQALGALACSGLGDGVLSATLGTTEALIAAVAAPSGAPELGRQGFCQGVITTRERRHHYILGGLFTAGASIEWFRQTVLGGVAHQELIAEAAAVPPGSRGACFLPQLLLGSAPNPSPHPNGAFWGLSLAADRGTLFRAILEGLAYEARLCSEALAALPGVAPIRQINAVGGDTRNALRMSIRATVCGTPIDVLGVEDATGLGAALMAGLGAGVYRDLDSAVAALVLPRTTIRPVAAQQPFYERYFNAVYRHAPSTLARLGQASASP